jgi:hypothetical protein
MLRRVVSKKLADVSEVLTASIIRAMVAEEVSTREPSVNLCETTWSNIQEDGHLQILSSKRGHFSQFKSREIWFITIYSTAVATRAECSSVFSEVPQGNCKWRNTNEMFYSVRQQQLSCTHHAGAKGDRIYGCYSFLTSVLDGGE